MLKGLLGDGSRFCRFSDDQKFLSLSLSRSLSLFHFLKLSLFLSFFLERTSVVKWCDGDTTRDQKISFSHFVKERKINRQIYGNWLQILRGLSYLRSGFWRHFGNLKGVEKVVCVKVAQKMTQIELNECIGIRWKIKWLTLVQDCPVFQT